MASLHLAYVPVDFSEHVYLNGIEVSRQEWTFDETSNRIVLDSGITTGSGDKVECRYAHLNVAAPEVVGDFVTVPGDHGSFTGGSFSNLTPAHTAGDLLICFLTTNGAALSVTPAGWTLYSSASMGQRTYIFTKIGAGQTTLTSDAGSFSGTNWYESTTMVYTGGLSSIAEIAWSAPFPSQASGSSVSTPGVSAGGRVLHYALSSNPNASWQNVAGYTRRFNHNWGNSGTHAVLDWVGDGSPILTWVETSSGTFSAMTATLALQ